MHLLALGLNHNSAPLRIRERAAVTTDHLGDALRSLVNQHEINEATILSTCNRTEIYCRKNDPNPQQVAHWLCDYHGLSSKDVQPYLYQYPDHNAVRHAFRVGAGLDSMALGESQILGQMKQAFSIARETGTTGKILNRLFQQTFNVAKRIRTDTDIGANAVSVAYAAVKLSKSIFADLKQQRVLMIGAGETIELTARHFKNNGVNDITVANRTIDRAIDLCEIFEAKPISLAELPTQLVNADIVISSTASTLPILGKGMVEQALKKRKHKPIFMVDLAVPRDVEEQVGELADIYLYTVDDLRNIVEENLESRKQAAQEAETIVESQTQDFMRWLRNLDVVPTIKQLHQRFDSISEDEIERATRRLKSGEDPELVIRNFARSFSKKLIHTPVEQLNQDDDGALISAARKLFGLKQTD